MGGWREEAAIANERTANLRDAIWASKQVDRIVVTSRDRCEVLSRYSIDAASVPFGYHPATAGSVASPTMGPRDIDVCIIGSGLAARRLRRGRILSRVLPRLEVLGQVVRLDANWGAERDRILRRTRVLVDVQRVPGNFTGLRFMLALAAGAAVVSEPVDDPHPFVAGIDHLEAPAEQIAGAVGNLLGNEPWRVRTVEAGQALLADELSALRSLERVLAA